MPLLTLNQQVKKLEEMLLIESNHYYFSTKPNLTPSWYVQFAPVLATSLAMLEDMLVFNEEVPEISREATLVYMNTAARQAILATPMPVKSVNVAPNVITTRRILGELFGISKQYQDSRWVRLSCNRKTGEHGEYIDDYIMQRNYVLRSRSEASVSGRDRKDPEKMIGMFALGMNQDEMLKRFPRAEEGQIFFETYNIEDLTKFGIFRPIGTTGQESKGKVIWNFGATKEDYGLV